MTNLIKAILSLCIFFLSLGSAANAARNTDSYDGNIFPIYAGNGSLVPPSTSLSKALEQNRTTVIIFYLDDSRDSKSFAPVVSGLKLVWGPEIDIIPLTTDELQSYPQNDPKEEAYYWHGRIPQVVVIDGDGNVLLDEEGQVPIENINEAISEATGVDAPPFSITIKSFNEYNSEPEKTGYSDPR